MANTDIALLQRRIEELERQLAKSEENSACAPDLLIHAGKRLFSAENPREVVRALVDLAGEFVRADAYAVWRQRSEDGAWVLSHASGLSDGYVNEVAANNPIGSWNVTDEPVPYEDVENEPLLPVPRASLLREGVRSMLAAPLHFRGNASRTLIFYWRNHHRCDFHEMRSASALGALAAGALGTADIIERRDAELELATDNVPVLISYVDRQERFRRVNHAYEELFGLKRDAILGKTIGEIVGPEHYQNAKPRIARAFSGERVQYCSRVRRHDGAMRDVELSYTPDRAPTGDIRGMVVMVQDITERRRLDEDRGRLAAIVDSSDDAIVSKTLDGIITTWNKGAERIFGYSAEEAVGRHITLIIPEERHAEEEYVLARIKQGERVDHFETERRTRDGRLIDISLTVSPVRNSDGIIIGASKTARDITEKRQSEERLIASERYLQTLLNSMPDCMKVLGPAGTVLQMNRAGLAILEADSPAQVLGQCAYSLIHEDDRDAFRSLNEAVFQGGPGGTLEFRVIGLKGAERTLETEVTPLLDSRGRVVGALSVTRDIGERKRAEEERLRLLAAERKTRETAELLNRIGPVLSAELDPRELTQKITDIATQAVGAEFGAFFYNLVDDSNESYLLYTLSGVPRAAFESFPMPRNTAVFGPTFRGEGAVRSGDITKDPRYGQNAPYRGMPEGHLPVRSYLAASVVSRSGEVLGGLLFGHSKADVFTEEAERIVTGIAGQAAVALDNALLFTELERSRDALGRTNEELKRANDDLHQFAYSASHDLQEPVRTMSVYSQLLRRKFENQLGADGLEYVQYIARGAVRMESLIRGLLAYTQAAGNEEVSAVVDAEAAVQGALANLSAAMEESGAAVTWENLPGVRIGLVQLTQLFQNLIGNALKYRRDESPRIRIQAESRGNEWLFSVEDNGIGIEQKYLEQIFGIFKRLHAEDQYSGTGIGLAICQRIVERAGGRIWVESEVGRGSTFYFTIPSGIRARIEDIRGTVRPADRG